jgi:hypothetical protein
MCKKSEFQVDLNSDLDAIQAEWQERIHTSECCGKISFLSCGAALVRIFPERFQENKEIHPAVREL